jgi:nitric oxide reductase subunit C
VKISHAKAIFICGTILSAVIFIALTYDSNVKLPQRTHEDKLDAEVAAGKWVWQKHNCNDCHTILGIGGYYAPDVTKVASYRDSAWMKKFLNDPEKVWPAGRKMPNLHLTDQEISELIAFLSWVNGIDTNNWPPKPVVAAASTSPSPGESLFRAQGCSACHTISGVGGKIGPDLTRVGSRRSKEWIEEQLENPKSHNPDSIMPSFAKLPKEDREALADYLSGLR